MTEATLMIPEATHLMPAITIGQAMTRYNTIVGFVKEAMRDGVDYGIIPGTDKPTLFKPGAEKLTTLFGLTPQFPIVREVEDWDGSQHGGEPFFDFWYKCQLWRGEMLIAEADGSCNSRESKYRWRWVGEEDIPPGLKPSDLKQRRGSMTEFAFAVDKAETGGKYGKPAEYWQAFKDAIENGTAVKTTRKTRAGKEYDAWQIDTTVYRVPNEDIFSQVNTMQKMAQKRALVAATLLAVNASEFFTQDLEDLDPQAIDANYTVIPNNGGDKPTGPAWTPEATAAGEDAPEQANGELVITSPAELLTAVNDATMGYYDAIPHMLNAIKKDTGNEGYRWPNQGDREAYAVAYTVLLEHAEANAKK